MRRFQTARPVCCRAETLEERRLLASVSFSAPVTTTINVALYNVSAVAEGDINNDGIPDLLVGHNNGAAQFFSGLSTGVFTPGLNVGPGAQLLTLDDFNGDGNLDVATAVGVLPGNGNGTFGTTPSGKTYALSPNTVALYSADVNGDGKADLIAATFLAGATTSDPATLGMQVLLGNGDGSLKAPIVTTLGSAVGIGRNFATLEFDDFNNDGKIDVLSPLGVALGNGDGTFKPTVPLPITLPPATNGGSTSTGSGGAIAPALPPVGVLAVGDFNNDNNLDVAVIPPPSASAGVVEILLGKGDGTFVDHGPVTVAAGQTITALAADDMNADGNIDLIAGVTSSANQSSLAVLLGNGDGTFGTPQLFATGGPPTAIYTGDFNNDGNQDLLSINVAAGSALNTDILIPVTASVLLNQQTVPVTPKIELGASTKRVIAGVPVKFAVALQAPTVSGAAKPSPAPTGTVTFKQGSTVLGLATLRNGRASLTAPLTGVGFQSITVTYSGDSNYAGATSTPITEVVLLNNSPAPLLSPALTTATLPALFLQKDKGTISLTITNGGGGQAIGRVSVNVYLSASGAVDSSAIPISIPSLQNRAISLASGRGMVLTASFVAGSYPPGKYKLVAQIVPLSGITADELTQDTFVSSSTFQAAGLVFGTVGAHKGLVLNITDGAGDRATLTLAGPGLGTVTQNAGLTDITLTGTNATSQLTINTHGGTFSFDTITDAGSIGAINARTGAVTGGITINGAITNLNLASAGTDPSGTMPITLGAGGISNLSLGTVLGVDLSSSSAIRTLTAGTWQGGRMIVPAIGTMNVKGVFDPDVQLHSGGKIQSVMLGTVTGGIWSVSGGIGSFRVNGDLANAQIYAGADAGPDNILGTADDRYSVAAIGSVFIGGADTSSLIAAGAAPAPGGNIFAGLTLLPKGAIRSVSVRGAVSDDSRFLASVLPARATLAGVLVKTSQDSHFQV